MIDRGPKTAFASLIVVFVVVPLFIAGLSRTPVWQRTVAETEAAHQQADMIFERLPD